MTWSDELPAEVATVYPQIFQRSTVKCPNGLLSNVSTVCSQLFQRSTLNCSIGLSSNVPTVYSQMSLRSTVKCSNGLHSTAPTVYSQLPQRSAVNYFSGLPSHVPTVYSQMSQWSAVKCPIGLQSNVPTVYGQMFLIGIIIYSMTLYSHPRCPQVGTTDAGVNVTCADGSLSEAHSFRRVATAAILSFLVCLLPLLSRLSASWALSIAFVAFRTMLLASSPVSITPLAPNPRTNSEEDKQSLLQCITLTAPSLQPREGGVGGEVGVRVITPMM